MSEWITDRLPKAEDALDNLVIAWYKGEIVVWPIELVIHDMPWQPIHKPAPYVKPKRWTVNIDDIGFNLREKNHRLFLPASCTAEAAQRIEDLFNEVLP